MTEMETMNSKVSLEEGLKGIHRVITRGFSIIDDTLQDFTQKKTYEIQSFKGFLDYLRCFTTLVHAHHSAEDLIVFPGFRNKTMEAPYGLLARTHVKMEAVVNDIKPLIEKLDEKKQERDTLEKIHQLIQTLNEIWEPHISIEECRFTENTISTYLSMQEQQQIATEIGRHMAETATPEYLVLPFIFYNLDSPDRKLMLPYLPPNINALLDTWKVHWEPMKPFLCD